MLLHMNLMITTNQKPIIDTHTKKRKESKHNITESHRSQGKRTKEERNKNNYTNEKAINKMAISAYLSIIYLSVNGLNAPVKRHRVAK